MRTIENAIGSGSGFSPVAAAESMPQNEIALLDDAIYLLIEGEVL